ncbi:MAG: hypothetical protein FDZ75_05930 [Actinobacteria bacterium]|nr:MAG: hypothetical protein FDZ75_05930 [Actinomycetota bacterium]
MARKTNSAPLKVLKWVGISLGTLLGVLILGLVLVPPLTRSFTDSWGATPHETQMPLPGDEFIANPTSTSTKAISIDAPGDLVYRLVIQIGYKRGGWYGWDWVYNATGSSDFVGGKHAERIVPELQRLRVGDTVAINQAVGYKVVELNPAGVAKPGWMLLQGAMGPDGKTVDAANAPKGTVKMSWVWFIYPGQDGKTRLVLRIRGGGDSQGAFLDWLYGNPFDFGGAVMGYKTLAGIKKTAEKLAAPKK